MIQSSLSGLLLNGLVIGSGSGVNVLGMSGVVVWLVPSLNISVDYIIVDSILITEAVDVWVAVVSVLASSSVAVGWLVAVVIAIVVVAVVVIAVVLIAVVVIGATLKAKGSLTVSQSLSHNLNFGGGLHSESCS